MTNLPPPEGPRAPDPRAGQAPPPQGGGWQPGPPRQASPQPPPPPPPGPPGGQWPPPPSGPGWTYGPPKPTDVVGRPLADWWKRVVAIFVDGLVVGVPLYIVLIAFGVVSLRTGNGCTIDQTTNTFHCTGAGLAGSVAVFYVLAIGVPLVYFALMDGGPRGQTVGKMLMHIATRDANTGGAIGPGRALLRRFVYEALWFIFFLPGLLNALSPLWDARRQAWHDKVASSVVVDVP